MSFAKTKGLFGGVSVESGVLVERRSANKKFYGKKVTADVILEGDVDVPEGERQAVEELMSVLGELFAADANIDGGGEDGDGQRGGDGVEGVPELGPSPGPQPLRAQPAPEGPV